MMHVLLTALVTILPFVRWRNAHHDIALVSQVAAVMGLFILAVHVAKRGYIRLPQSPVVWLSFAWCGVLLGSFYITRRSSINYEPLILMYTGMAYLWAGYAFITRRDRHSIHWAMLAAGAILSGMWLWRHYVGGAGFVRCFIYYGQKNAVALTMFFGLVMALKYAGHHYRPLRYVALLACILILNGINATICTGIIILSVIAIISSLIRRFDAVILAILVGFVIQVSIDVGNTGTAAGRTIESAKMEDPTHGRVSKIWPDIWRQIKEKPLWGAGIGDLRQNGIPADAGPHNHYFFLHGAGGIFSVILWVAMVAFVFFRTKDFYIRIAIVGYCTYAAVSSCAVNWQTNLVYFWLLIASELVPRQRYLADRHSVPVPVRAGLCGISGVLTVGLVGWFLVHNIVLNNFVGGVGQGNRGNIKTGIGCMNTCTLLEPRFYRAYYARGKMFLGAGRPDLALKDFKAVLALTGTYADTEKMAGVCRGIIQR